MEEDVALVSNTSATTSNDGLVANSGYTATTPGTYKWLAIYSGDNANNGVTSNCVEEFTIDNYNTAHIDNGPSTISRPSDPSTDPRGAGRTIEEATRPRYASPCR